MFNGRIQRYAKLQIRCGFSASGYSLYSTFIGSKQVAITVQCDAYYETAGPVQSDFGMLIQAKDEQHDDHTGGGHYPDYPSTTYSLRWFNSTVGTYNYTHTESVFNTADYHYVEFIGYETWVTPNQEFLVKWDSATWCKSDGTVLQSFGSSTIASGLGDLLPSGIPWFNGSLTVSANALVAVQSTDNARYVCQNGNAVNLNATSDLLAGWRASIDGTTWITPPVSWQDSHIGGNGTTWLPDAQVYGYQSRDFGVFGRSSHRVDSNGHYYWLVGVHDQKYKNSDIQITILPCYPREVSRVNADGECAVRFFAFDKIQYWITAPDGSGDPVQTFYDYLPATSTSVHLTKNNPSSPETISFTSTVLPGNHHISWGDHGDGIGGGPTYWATPQPDGSLPALFGYLDGTAIPSTDPDFTTAGTSYDNGNETYFPYFPNAYVTMPYIQSSWGVFQYWNAWCHPHWNCMIAVGPQHLGGVGAVPWTDSDYNPGYFNDIQQTYDIDAVPSGERTQHRADQIIPPFQERALGALLDSASGYVGTYWWGNNGLVWMIPTPIDHVNLGASSSSRWTFKNGSTVVSGGSVTDSIITIPAGANIAEFDLSNWGVYPFGYCAIVTQIVIAAGATNVNSWMIEMVGEDGATITICTTPGTASIPAGIDTKWSISDAIQFGNPDVIADTYQSIATTSDDSATVYGGSWTGFVSGKISSRSGTKLRLTVVATDATTAVTFPSWRLNASPVSDMKVFPLTAQTQALCIKNGPSLMLGALSFFDSASQVLIDSPNIITGIGPGQLSAGDYMCLYLSVFQAKKPTTNFRTLASSMFVWGSSGEIEFSQDKHFWSDPVNQAQLTTGFALGPYPVFCLCNSYRAIPPLAFLPEKKRTRANHWSPATADGYEQVGYMSGNTRRYAISPAKAKMIAPTGAPDGTAGTNVLTTDSADIVPGWFVQFFGGRVSNDEGYTYSVRLGSTEFAKVRPWRGWLFFTYQRSPSRPIGYDVALSTIHTRTSGDNTGELWLGIASNNDPTSWADLDTGIAATWARPRFEDYGTKQAIGIFYGDGTNCFWARTTDHGATWHDTTSLGAGMIGDYDEGYNGIRWFYKVVSAGGGYNITCTVLDSQLGTVRAETTTNLTGVDNAPIAVRESYSPEGAWRMGIYYSIGGVETFKLAPDGLTFA